MRRLRVISLLFILAGLLLLAAVPLLTLDPVWAVAALMLTWAGVVKVVVIHLWRGLGRDDVRPSEAE